jgi:predicted permease
MLDTIMNPVVISATAATTADFASVGTTIASLLENILKPLVLIIGSLGAIWCVLLGVKLAKADEPQEREKAKMALKNAIVGYVLIFVLVVALRLTIGPLYTWMQGQKSTLSASAAGAVTVTNTITASNDNDSTSDEGGSNGGWFTVRV